MTAQSVEPLPLVPVLRLVPAPVCAPPYDDELVSAPVLRLPPAPAPPELVRPLRALPRAAEPAIEDADDWCTPRRTPTAQLPASQPFARALVQGLLEVLAGVRPVKQLQRDTTAELYAVLEQTVGRQPRTVGPRPGAPAGAQPAPAGAPGGRRGGVRDRPAWRPRRRLRAPAGGPGRPLALYGAARSLTPSDLLLGWQPGRAGAARLGRGGQQRSARAWLRRGGGHRGSVCTSCPSRSDRARYGTAPDRW